MYIGSFEQKKIKARQALIQCPSNNRTEYCFEYKHGVAWAVSVTKFSYRMELLGVDICCVK